MNPKYSSETQHQTRAVFFRFPNIVVNPLVVCWPGKLRYIIVLSESRVSISTSNALLLFLRSVVCCSDIIVITESKCFYFLNGNEASLIRGYIAEQVFLLKNS